MRFRKLAAGGLAATVLLSSLQLSGLVSAEEYAEEQISAVTEREGINDASYKEWSYESIYDDSGECTGVRLIEYRGSDKDVTVPATFTARDSKTYPVKELEYTFDKNTTVESVTIPNTVEKIGNRTFGDCSKLKSVTLSDSITSIGQSAFSHCEKLEAIEIPDSVKSIGQFAFSGCSALKSVEIPVGIEIIEWGTFQECTALESVVFPDTLKSIGNSAFFNCTSLTSVELPDSVTSLDYRSFSACSSLKSVIISKGLTSIAREAFSFCTALESIEIPNNITSIEESAFHNCTALKYVVIPDSVINLGKLAFVAGFSLEYVIISKNIKTISSEVFAANLALKSVEIPEGVTDIEDQAFRTCRSLSSVIIPKSVTNIGSEIFSDYPASLKIYGYNGSFAAETFSSGDLPFVSLDNPEKLQIEGLLGIVVESESSALSGLTLEAEQTVFEEDLKSYEIAFKDTSGSNVNSLKEKINVTIPIDSEWYRGGKVYRIEADGTRTDMNAVYERSILTFTTDKFGEFVVVPTISVSDEETGVSVTGEIPANSQLAVAADDENSTDTRLVYDISLTKDGEELQPNGTVTVRIPVPEKFKDKATELNIYHLVDGKYTDMNAKLEGKYLVFKTDHFSIYVVTPDVLAEKPDSAITVTDKETGISISGAVPKGAQLNVAADTENSSNTRLAYNISLTKDGSEVQPNGTVTVKIPVPKEFEDKAAKLKVYYFIDGEYTNMNAKLEDGYLVFETDHFSIYVVTPDVIPEKPNDTTGTEPAPDASSDIGVVIVPMTTVAEATSATAAATTAEMTTTVPVTEVPVNTDSGSADTTQPVPADNSASDNTADNGAANIGNTGDNGNKDPNPDTGSVIAIVPVIVAAAAVSLFAYKRKK